MIFDRPHNTPKRRKIYIEPIRTINDVTTDDFIKISKKVSLETQVTKRIVG